MSLLTFALAASFLAAAAGQEEGFRPLFNGTDLSGWVPVNTAPSTWSFEDGMLVCSGKPIGELRTDRMYQNFILELEWRHLVPKGNAGVFIWADDITARGQPFHRGIEVQVLENAYGNTKSHTTHGDIFPIHGATMTPVNGRGGSRSFPSESRSKPSPEWNHYRIECVDGAITLSVNGKVVNRGEDCSPRKGYICIESEGGIVHYRNVRIKELPDSPIEAKDVAIADRGYRCRYTGVDLAGWKTGGREGDRWQPKDWVLSFTGTEAGSSIATEEEFEDFGFIFDIRLPKDKPVGGRVFLRGSEDAAVNVRPEDVLIGPLLEKPGNWNRFEGTFEGDRLSLMVNGQEAFKDRALAAAPGRGPIAFFPDGPMDVANVYTRALASPGKEAPPKASKASSRFGEDSRAVVGISTSREVKGGDKAITFLQGGALIAVELRKKRL